MGGCCPNSSLSHPWHWLPPPPPRAVWTEECLLQHTHGSSTQCHRKCFIPVRIRPFHSSPYWKWGGGSPESRVPLDSVYFSPSGLCTVRFTLLKSLIPAKIEPRVFLGMRIGIIEVPTNFTLQLNTWLLFVGTSIILFTVAGNRLVWTSWKHGPTGKAQTWKTSFLVNSRFTN